MIQEVNNVKNIDCHKRQLNQALSVLSLSLGFLLCAFCAVLHGHFCVALSCTHLSVIG